MSKFSVGFSDVLYETKRAGDSRLHNSVECWRIKESGKIIGYIKNRDQAFAIVDVLNAPLYHAAPPIHDDKVMVPRKELGDLISIATEAHQQYGMFLLTDPPQEAWKFYRIAQRLADSVSSMIEAAKEG